MVLGRSCLQRRHDVCHDVGHRPGHTGHQPARPVRPVRDGARLVKQKGDDQGTKYERQDDPKNPEPYRTAGFWGRMSMTVSVIVGNR
ncbi:MAG: hypothetical protein MPJ22_06385 [Pirellulales bacterium]|nr:hypothetical protein [Pirellulales bacterium]